MSECRFRSGVGTDPLMYFMVAILLFQACEQSAALRRIEEKVEVNLTTGGSDE